MGVPRAQSPEIAVLDPSALGGALTVRAWRQGDRMRPLGLRGTKSLQDLFTDRKVPRSLRQFYFYESSLRALARYSAAPYEGTVCLLITAKPFACGWQELCSGGARVVTSVHVIIAAVSGPAKSPLKGQPFVNS